MTITVDPTPPVKPPATVKVTLSKPFGTVKLIWDDPDQEPKEVTLSQSEQSFELEIPDGTDGLLLECDGHQAVNVV